MDKRNFATLPPEEIVKTLSARATAFYKYIDSCGLRGKWRRSEDLFFGRHHGEAEGHASVVQAGDNGELASYGVNHYRNLIKHILALTTSQRPSLDPKAKNTDLASIQQTRLAGNILDSYMTDKRLGRHMSGAAERSLVKSKGFMYMPWNPSLGKPYTTQAIQGENGQVHEKIVYEGDIDAIAKSPEDVIYNPKLRDWTKSKWVIIRGWESRWDLAARYPDKAEKILGLTSEDEIDPSAGTRKLDDEWFSVDDELVATYEFYHVKTDSVPNGRYVKFLNGDISLYDGPIPYKRLPIFRIAPGDVFDSCEGYTDAYDIMALQEVVNVLYSIPFTNQQALGVQFLHLPDGCELSETMFKGLAVLKGGAPGTEPRALQLTSTAAEVFTNIQKVEGAMEKLSGINSTVRGDPEHNLKSGLALGRMQTMAIQFASNFQKSWAELNEDVGSFLFELLKTYAKTERIAAIAGKSNKGSMIAFTGDDIKDIERVEVNLGNPLARTAAGRLEMADKFFEKGQITVKQYMQIASTGQLDSIFESEESELELIRKENEDLMDGKPVSAIIGDMHLAHAKEHKTVINDPMIRSLAAQGDSQAIAIIQAVTSHIQEHEQLYMTQTPFFGMMSGEPPPPPPPMPPPLPGPDGGLPPPEMGPPPPPEPPPIAAAG